MVVLSEKTLPYIVKETDWVRMDDMWIKEYTYNNGKTASIYANSDPRLTIWNNVLSLQSNNDMIQH